jgi:hypothetical protein
MGKQIVDNELSLADIEGTLNVLLLVTALTLTFSIPLLTSLNRDDLVAADTLSVQANWAYFREQCPDLEERPWGSSNRWQDCGLLSYGLFDSAYMSTACLTISLILGMSIYLGMCNSDVRENQHSMEKWFSYFQYALYVAYMLFFVGCVGLKLLLSLLPN